MSTPLFQSTISAGFPSVATDHIENMLDLNTLCIKNKSSTFFLRCSGFSMIGAGISDGDILVVDRSLSPSNRSIVIAYLNGEFTVKRIIKRRDGISLMPENPTFAPIEIRADMDFEVWGVVTYIIKKAT